MTETFYPKKKSTR